MSHAVFVRVLTRKIHRLFAVCLLNDELLEFEGHILSNLKGLWSLFIVLSPSTQSDMESRDAGRTNELKLGLLFIFQHFRIFLAQFLCSFLDGSIRVIDEVVGQFQDLRFTLSP